MARIRTVKPEFFTHEELYDLEAECGLPVRLAFIGLWTVCDREGRFKWRPRSIKANVMPHDDIDFSRVLDALVTRGFVVRYACDGGEYAYIPGFCRHQVVNNREAPSVLPEPPLTRAPRVADACLTRESRVPHASSDASCGEGKGKEGERKGREGDSQLCETVLTYWNDSKAKAKIRKLTSDRKTKLAIRLRDPDWPWREAIDKLPIANTERFTWQPDFDWLIENDRNAYSLAEGKYDAKPVSLFGPGQNYDPNHNYEAEAF